MTALVSAQHYRQEQGSFSIKLSKSKLRIVLAVLLGAAFATIGFKHLNWAPGWLQLSAVQVVGNLTWTDQARLQQVVQPFVNANFFDADLLGLKQAVQQLPWIKSVSVRRVWPNKLRLHIVEQRAIALWGNEFLVNAEGELFAASNKPGELVQLQGPEGMHQRLYQQYQELQELYAQYDMEIQRMSVNQRRAMEVELSNGMVFLFGRLNASSDAYIMASRFFNAYEHGLNQRLDSISEVDLRYTNGFAVRWGNKKSTHNDNNAGDNLTG